MTPSFLRILADPTIKTVMLCGCGGGFDFVHSLLLYPTLKSWGKEIVIGSYSFGDPHRIKGESPAVFGEGETIVKRVTSQSIPAPRYCPEVHVASFLDANFPEDAPHSTYAYYARAFTVPSLLSWLEWATEKHQVDALVLFDGGSDSLMKGDEEGVGDPVEDAVSIASAALLKGIKQKLLISVGLGTDRFNQVSDASSLRAIAELTQSGGFLGGLCLEPTNEGFLFYQRCLEHIYERQRFRSVISGSIQATTEGAYGAETIPKGLEERLNKGDIFLWPLMAMLWAFDVEKVDRRSLMTSWIRHCETPLDCLFAIGEERQKLGEALREVEDLPRHEDMRHKRRLL